MISKKWGITYKEISDICDLVDTEYYGKNVNLRIEAKRKLKKECNRLGITVDQAYAMYKE